MSPFIPALRFGLQEFEFSLCIRLARFLQQLFALCDNLYSQIEFTQVVPEAISKVEVQVGPCSAVLKVQTDAKSTRWVTISLSPSSAWSVEILPPSQEAVTVQPIPLGFGSPAIEDDGVVGNLLREYTLAVVEDDGLAICAVHKMGDHIKTLYRQPRLGTQNRLAYDAVVPLSLDKLYLLSPTGEIQSTHAQALAQDSTQLLRPPTSHPPHNPFTAIKVVLQPMSRRKLILAGTLQGDILLWSVWNAQQPALVNKFHVLDSAIVRIVPFLTLSDHPAGYDTSNAVNDYVACVTADGTVALVQVETCQVSMIVPGRGAALSLLAVQGLSLLLLYADEFARIWDLRTLELRQSVPAARAYTLLQNPNLSILATPAPTASHALGKDRSSSLAYATPWTIHDMRDDVHGYSLKIKTGILIAPDRASPINSPSPVLEADLRKAIDAAHKAISKALQSTIPPSSGASPHSTLLSAPNVDCASVQPTPLCPLGSPAAKKALSVLGPLVAALLPCGVKLLGTALAGALGLFDDRKELLMSLGVRHSASTVYAFATRGTANLYPPVYTRQLVALLAMLRILANVSELQPDAHQALTAVLSQGNTPESDMIRDSKWTFHPVSVSLPTLAPWIFDANPHVAWAAQIVCDKVLEDAPDSRVVQYVTEMYTSSLIPARRPAHQSRGPSARARAGIGEGEGERAEMERTPVSARTSPLPTDMVALLGFLACRRVALFTSPILRDISLSVEAFVNDTLNPGSLLVALHLCRDGFAIWQNYIDPMDLLRSLFRVSWQENGSFSAASALAPPPVPGSTPASTPSASHGLPPRANGTSHARTTGSHSVVDGDYVSGTLRYLAQEVTQRIAYVNTPLFMSTLVHDVLLPRTLTDCQSSMAFVTYLVRADPGLLTKEVPRLTGAVVRALDPPLSLLPADGSASSAAVARDALRHEAIQLIDALVQTFPAMTFNEASQRLAVGTLEGGVVAYDVRAVTRLYVIEAHATGPVHMVSFSPDGRRLVTLGLNDQGGTARVWKTGTTLSSVFSLGSLPRQGGNDPLGAYKAIRVDVPPFPAQGADAPWPLECDWVGDHQTAHLRIGSLGLSFETA